MSSVGDGTRYIHKIMPERGRFHTEKEVLISDIIADEAEERNALTKFDNPHSIIVL